MLPQALPLTFWARILDRNFGPQFWTGRSGRNFRRAFSIETLYRNFGPKFWTGILDQVKADLLAKVVEKPRRLKRMQDAYEPPSLDASTITAGTCFSAIQTAVQHESIER